MMSSDIAVAGISMILSGLSLTLSVTFVAAAASIVLGAGVAALRSSRWAVAQAVGAVYVQVFRSVSPYVYILWLYFGLKIVTGVDLTPFLAGVIGLSLLYSAYMVEVIRAGFAAVPAGQRAAGKSLGMTDLVILRHITFPQMARTTLPSVFSLIIILFKDSSLVAVIGAQDVMHKTLDVVTQYDNPIFFYSVAALVYIASVMVANIAVGRLSSVLNRPYVRSA